MLTVESPKNLVPKFFDDTAQTYDRIALWTTFGKDQYWKRVMLDLVPKADSYLDLACGTGILTRKIAQKFPDSKVLGLDISERYLEVAKKNSSQYKNITFVKGDAETALLHERFGCIVSSYIPKYCDAKVLADTFDEHLKPGGKVILHDFLYPKNRLLQGLWVIYFEILGFVGFFIPTWKYAFRMLPGLIRTSRWLDDYDIELKKHGFETCKKNLTWGTSAILAGTKT